MTTAQEGTGDMDPVGKLPTFGVYGELERLRAEVESLHLAIRALTHWAVREDEHGDTDLAGMPDGHAFEVVWGGEDTETDTAFTAGQVRRALALLPARQRRCNGCGSTWTAPVDSCPTCGAAK